MKRLVFSASVLFGVVGVAQAQIPVTDAANLFQNTVQAAQTVFVIANQILELTGLDGIVLGEDLANDVTTLAALGEEAKGLTFDIATIQQKLKTLFDVNAAPNNSRALQARLAEVRRLTYTLYCDALAVQSLLQSSLSALRHLTRLIQGIGGLVGNHQSNQTLAQLDSTLTVELAKLRAQTSAYHRAHLVDRLSEPLILESIQRVNEQLMEDWPRP